MANWEYAFEVRGVRSNVASYVHFGPGGVHLIHPIDYDFIDQLTRIRNMIEGAR